LSGEKLRAVDLILKQSTEAAFVSRMENKRKSLNFFGTTRSFSSYNGRFRKLFRNWQIGIKFFSHKIRAINIENIAFNFQKIESVSNNN
jgi:hypothetical protein